MCGADRFWKTRAKQCEEEQRHQSALVSGERDQFEIRSIRKKRGQTLSWTDERTTILGHFKAFTQTFKQTNIQL